MTDHEVLYLIKKGIYSMTNDSLSNKNILSSTRFVNKNTLYMNGSIKEFLTLNPPCNECLIQSMCIAVYTFDIWIKYCPLLEKFISNYNGYTVVYT